MNPKKELLCSLRVDSSLKLERVQVLRFWVEGLRREGLIGSKGTCTTTTRGLHAHETSMVSVPAILD